MNEEKAIEELKSLSPSEEAIETVLNLLEKKDKKLRDIENHIKAELRMIDKCFNEVWMGRKRTI